MGQDKNWEGKKKSEERKELERFFPLHTELVYTTVHMTEHAEDCYYIYLTLFAHPMAQFPFRLELN